MRQPRPDRGREQLNPVRRRVLSHWARSSFSGVSRSASSPAASPPTAPGWGTQMPKSTESGICAGASTPRGAPQTPAAPAHRRRKRLLTPARPHRLLSRPSTSILEVLAYSLGRASVEVPPPAVFCRRARERRPKEVSDRLGFHPQLGCQFARRSHQSQTRRSHRVRQGLGVNDVQRVRETFA